MSDELILCHYCSTEFERFSGGRVYHSSYGHGVYTCASCAREAGLATCEQPEGERGEKHYAYKMSNHHLACLSCMQYLRAQPDTAYKACDSVSHSTCQGTYKQRPEGMMDGLAFLESIGAVPEDFDSSEAEYQTINCEWYYDFACDACAKANLRPRWARCRCANCRTGSNRTWLFDIARCSNAPLDIADEMLAYDADVHRYCKPEFPLNSKRRMYGIELEMEAQDYGDHQEIISEFYDNFSGDMIIKSDGSLSECGLEMVTRAMSFETAYKFLARFCTDRPTGLNSWNNTGARCGMHIHVSKNAVPKLALGKVLLYMNNGLHRAFIENLAGRSSSRWARFRPKKWLDARSISDKYEAVNTAKRGTFEFRIFRGSLLQERLQRNLEFTDAIVTFAQNTECYRFEGVSLQSAFFDHVAKEKKRYALLNDYIQAYELTRAHQDAMIQQD